MGNDDNLLGQECFPEASDRERYHMLDKGVEGLGGGRSGILACERGWDFSGHGSEGQRGSEIYGRALQGCTGTSEIDSRR